MKKRQRASQASASNNIDGEIPATRPTEGEKPRWKKVTGESARAMPEWLGALPASTSVQEPIDYFRYFFDNVMLEHIIEQSNLYSVQVDPEKPLQLTLPELEQFIGTVMYMSLIVLPRRRLYWSSAFRTHQVSDVISRDRWEEVKTNIHFNDNSQMPPYDDPNRDKLYKLRPLVNMLLNKFRNIPLDHMLCVDEQMVPFKGISSLRQYMPKKPNKWGYKIFVLCDDKGIVYNFEVFTGKIQPHPNLPDLGASSNIVLRLSDVIPKHKNYLLYFDNWFTSLALMAELSKTQIYCLGTVRSNRLLGCNFTPDGELKSKGRGSFEEKEALVQGQTVRVVKWYDSRAVLLASSFSSAQPIGKTMRFDRRVRAKIDIDCPSMVVVYNKFMGGVDLLDSLMALYRISIRSKKYYMRLFFHFIDMATVTSWLLYRRDCMFFGVSNKNQLPLFSFKASIAEALCKENKGNNLSKKRGRPSSGVDSQFEKKKKAGHATMPIPQKNVRMDQVGHWPIISEKRGRCKLPNCKGSPSVMCKKCNVHLCIEKKRNCFVQFHVE